MHVHQRRKQSLKALASLKRVAVAAQQQEGTTSDDELLLAAAPPPTLAPSLQQTSPGTCVPNAAPCPSYAPLAAFVARLEPANSLCCRRYKLTLAPCCIFEQRRDCAANYTIFHLAGV